MQGLQAGGRAAQWAATRIVEQAAALGLNRVDQQVHTHFFLQPFAPGMDAQRIDRVAMQPRYTADVVIDALIQQGDFHGLGVVGKQLQVNIVQACGGAAPHGAPDQGFKRLQSLHPQQSQLA